MYQFATVALLGLGVLGVTNLVAEIVPDLARFRTLAMFVLAVAGVVALDYSVLAGFGIHVRQAWMGPWVTGVIVASLASAWQATLAWLQAPERAVTGTDSARRPRIAA
ncbi:MAG TPA: hypothetical protein VHS52_09835 [Acidimicrobiales bacterium]|nr:hypothetical protein [Acidimicrobiales bacterium]